MWGGGGTEVREVSLFQPPEPTTSKCVWEKLNTNRTVSLKLLKQYSGATHKSVSLSPPAVFVSILHNVIFHISLSDHHSQSQTEDKLPPQEEGGLMMVLTMSWCY